MKGVFGDESSLRNIQLSAYFPEVHYRVEAHLTNSGLLQSLFK